MNTDYDVIILGAGPAGCTAALALRDSGLKVALLDKAGYPRDKVCGDAIPGPTFKVLRSLAPELEEALFDLPERHDIQASQIVAMSGRSLTWHWHTRSYNSKRIDFDNYLLSLVKKNTATEVLEQTHVQQIHRTDDAVVLTTKTGNSLRSQLVMGADGAHSVVAKQLAQQKLNRYHHCGAVRAYVRHVADLEPGRNEFYLFKQHLPGYFWVFPLANGWANVGFGMRSSDIARRRINLSQTLRDIMENEPNVRAKFVAAEMMGPVQGFGLPLGSRLAPLSGDGFMLLGDAGSLIDPLQGHGIDKAVLSGKLAAQQALNCFAKQRFDAAFMRSYDQCVRQHLQKEFRRNYRLMQLLHRWPEAVDVICRIGNWPLVQRLVKAVL